MRDGFKVIDADRHVLEPSDLFAKYLPEKFRSRVEIQGPNQSYRRVDGEMISDADGCATRPNKKISALPSPPRNDGAKPSPTRWRRNSIPRPTSATWTKKASTSACSSPPWASTSCGATISIPNSRRHLPRLQHLAVGLLQREPQAALRRRLDTAAGPGPRGRRVEVRQREARPGRHLLAA